MYIIGIYFIGSATTRKAPPSSAPNILTLMLLTHSVHRMGTFAALRTIRKQTYSHDAALIGFMFTRKQFNKHNA